MDKPLINLSAIFHHSGGYSELARNLAEVLYDLGVLAHIDSRNVERNFQPAPVASYASKKFMDIHAEMLAKKTFYDQPNIVMQFVPPFMFAPVKDMLSIGVTMFETRVPESWGKSIANVQYLMVHDRFQSELFKGFPVKQWSWEPWVGLPNSADGPEGNSPVPGPYFLTVGVARVHKNQSKIIAAFKEFRKNNPQYYLVIKAITEDVEYDDYRADLTDDHIIVIPGPYSESAMGTLYGNCHAYISASMCEGLDMPAIKAAKCGKPVIISRHTGHEDWVPEHVQVLKTDPIDMSTLRNIHPRYREKAMMGYDTTAEEILWNMNMLLEKPELYRIDLSGRFTYDACKQSIAKLLDVIKGL